MVPRRDAARPEEQDNPALGPARHKSARDCRPAHQIGPSLRRGRLSLFGAICPARGTGAAIVMPHANSQVMQHHLDEIARLVSPTAHPLVILDQAAWHTTEKLRLPDTLSLWPLPPKSPALNPAENVWQSLRQNKLSNPIFDGCEAILTAACQARNSLLADPKRITSIGTQSWADTGQS